MKSLTLVASTVLVTILSLSHSAEAQVNSTDSADIGLSQLRAANPGLTEGAGVKAHLVEAFTGTVDYLPDPDHAQLVGNLINPIGVPADLSPSDSYSGHALSSALHFFGSGGVARDLGTGGSSIDAYAAALADTTPEPRPTVDWLSSNLFRNFSATTTGTPNVSEFDRSTVTSHSYVFLSDPTDQLVVFLQRLDFLINESDTTTVVGSGNGGAIPPGWAPSYNAITVGLSRGTHGDGLTTTYGAGRVAINVVAPEPLTSSSTPVVAGAVAILQDAADGSDAARSEVIRATIMAGATKGADDIDGTWTRTQTQPLDSTFGAGELNIFNSYNIQQAGEFDGGDSAGNATVLADPNGWDYEEELATNGELFYEFSVGQDQVLENLSIVLTWNLNVVDTDASPNNFTPNDLSAQLADLNLELFDAAGNLIDQSISSVDNVEHIFVSENSTLCEGTYLLRVSNSNLMATDFGLAWRGTLSPFVLGDVDDSGTVDFLDISPFIAILSGGEYQPEADIDKNGLVDFLDISPFIALLSQ